MENINESKKIARIAGIWYLVLAIGAGYSWMFITNVYVDGNATLTAENIIRSDFRYIIAIIFSIIGQLAFILLGLTLYRLLKQVNKDISKIMVTLVLVSIPIMFVAIIIETGALLVLKRADYLNVFTIEQIQSIAMTFVSLHITGVHIVTIFWGLWLFPLAYLVYKSNFIPKAIAILLILSGICYCIGSMSSLISPGFYAKIEPILSIPETIGEVSLLLWLLIKGVSVRNN
ncbi:MAG: DUF4386 domain-containing protein [Tannerellaceae bacterium]|jgi:hypothetical protein|nr:DUF4386 domain-containing protein [Tannerellaceae bacterium]